MELPILAPTISIFASLIGTVILLVVRRQRKDFYILVATILSFASLTGAVTLLALLFAGRWVDDVPNDIALAATISFFASLTGAATLIVAGRRGRELTILTATISLFISLAGPSTFLTFFAFEVASRWGVELLLLGAIILFFASLTGASLGSIGAGFLRRFPFAWMVGFVAGLIVTSVIFVIMKPLMGEWVVCLLLFCTPLAGFLGSLITGSVKNRK